LHTFTLAVATPLRHSPDWGAWSRSEYDEFLITSATRLSASAGVVMASMAAVKAMERNNVVLTANPVGN